MPLKFAPEEIESILTKWKSERWPDMKRRQDYFVGEHDIKSDERSRIDGEKPARIVTNWCRLAVAMYVGAITKEPWRFVPRKSEASDEAFEAFRDMLNEQSIKKTDGQHVRDALVLGRSVEVHAFFPDEDLDDPDKDLEGGMGGTYVIQHYDAKSWCLIRDVHSNLWSAFHLQVIEPFTVYKGKMLTEETKIVTVYDEVNIQVWIEVKDTTNDKNKVWHMESERGHKFGRIPVVVFSTSVEELSFLDDPALSNQDAYNTTASMQVEDIQYEVGALLKVRGFDVDDMAKNAAQIRKLKMIPLGADPNNDAEYLTKGIQADKFTTGLDRARVDFFEGLSLPDFRQIVGATGQTTGVALKLKLGPMVDRSKTFFNYLEEAVRARVDLWNSLRLKSSLSIMEDYEVIATIQPPTNEAELWAAVAALDTLLDDETKIGLLGVGGDPRELKRKRDRQRAEQALATADAGDTVASDGVPRLLDASTAEPAALIAARTRTSDKAVANVTPRIEELFRKVLADALKGVPRQRLENLLGQFQA